MVRLHPLLPSSFALPSSSSLCPVLCFDEVFEPPWSTPRERGRRELRESLWEVSLLWGSQNKSTDFGDQIDAYASGLSIATCQEIISHGHCEILRQGPPLINKPWHRHGVAWSMHSFPRWARQGHVRAEEERRGPHLSHSDAQASRQPAGCKRMECSHQEKAACHCCRGVMFDPRAREGARKGHVSWTCLVADTGRRSFRR